ANLARPASDWGSSIPKLMKKAREIFPMSKRPPDFSFERDGRPLSAWLVDLVAEEVPARLTAGEALKAMYYALPDARTDLTEIRWDSPHDLADHSRRFRERIRAAAGARGFPTPEFVRHLIAYRIALNEDWRRRADRVRQREARQDAIDERLIRRVEAA